MKDAIKILILLLFLIMGHYMTTGQEQEITDRDLQSYYMTVQKIDSVRISFEDKTSKMIKSNLLLEEGKVYLLIKESKRDSIPLEQVASNQQITAYHIIESEIDSLKSSFKQAYSEVIQKEMGIIQFNLIRRMLKSDSVSQEKYKSISEKYENVLVESSLDL